MGTIANSMYLVSFDMSKKAREERTIYSDVEKRLLDAARNNGIMIDMGNEGKMFNYLFSDMNQAAHFYSLLLSEREEFEGDFVDFKKYGLNQVPLTQKEQAFLHSKDPRDIPNLIGKD